DPLLRTDQDATGAATHREWPSRLWRDGAADARFHTPFTRAGVFAQGNPRFAPPGAPRRGALKRVQGNCEQSSRRHRSHAGTLKKAGAAPRRDGSPMLGQKSTKLPRFGHSRYSAGKTVSFAFVIVARAAVAGLDRGRRLVLRDQARRRDSSNRFASNARAPGAVLRVSRHP